MEASVGIIGAGAWGTALAIQAARAGARVTLWARNPAGFAANPRLPGVSLPMTVQVTGTIPNAGILLVAVPMQQLRAVLGLLPQRPLLLCCKGMETGTGLLPLEVASMTHTQAAILTGPNFAAEIAAGQPAAAVIAGHDRALRDTLIGVLGTQNFRLYGNDDPMGAQLGGAAKNVVAIAAGAVIGAGLGENARAALITRGIAEIARLAAALGGKRDTVHGLSGLGDLVLTCTGAASRNFRLGLALGRGETPPALLCEGVATAPALVGRATIELPICAAVANLVQNPNRLEQTIETLLKRPLRDE